MIKPIAIAIVFFLISLSIHAQVKDTSEIYRTLKTKDSLLFNIGFNTCDISQFESLVSDNFEFYHDKAGITSSNLRLFPALKMGFVN